MLKIKLIIFLLLLSVNAMAADKTIIENIKAMQLYIDKGQFDKVEDVYDEYEETLGKNWMALERLAISFERREKFKEAIEIYRKIITNFNKIAHDKILKTPSAKIESSYYDKTKLQLYYYKLAFLNTQLFSKTNSYTPTNERNKYRKNAEGFIGLSRKIKVDNGDLESLEDLLQDKIIKDESLSYRGNWYLSMDFISWQDRVLLVDNISGTSTKLLSTAIGTCVGGGKKWENVNFEFDLEGCFAVANSTISSEDRNVGYEQSSVSVQALMLGPGMYFKGISDNVLFGIHLPIKFRQGDWTNPDETQYSFENKTSTEIGYFLQSKIKIKNFSIRTRLGKVFPNPGSLWSIGLLYDF